MTRINRGLSNYVLGRTVAAVADIERAKAILRREMITGEIKLRCDDEGRLNLSHKDISKLAGRHWNFLNAVKHKETTKVDVEDFLKWLHEDFERLYCQSLVRVATINGDANATDTQTELELVKAELERVKAELAELNVRHERVASHIHGWALQLRSARAEIRLLRSEKTPTVVLLRPPKPKPRANH
ncbi:hypothetical protein [Rhizobium laguerreae]|uniref:hypothetical protein n=1 Tax=Rhizobium laguerreae TaxID=1076926 RepID=UPI001C91B116|nr:hypothetical protein [Rhizobium laguerreae]MBY3342866.1 hypothetical protein [Rhizobium laguerreae]MBY3349901.1 hypothetical protein [Rhizobium laguerreae]MBY3371004.1 hypothetical protein [Rhizobium laguerreae]MBY3426244.1 hypothetical protein [Rhizobium laguerreae]MBY3434204.1 hypothetical protein [Rhizobium laguerreae]